MWGSFALIQGKLSIVGIVFQEVKGFIKFQNYSSSLNRQHMIHFKYVVNALLILNGHLITISETFQCIENFLSLFVHRGLVTLHI